MIELCGVAGHLRLKTPQPTHWARRRVVCVLLLAASSVRPPSIDFQPIKLDRLPVCLRPHVAHELFRSETPRPAGVRHRSRRRRKTGGPACTPSSCGDRGWARRPQSLRRAIGCMEPPPIFGRARVVRAARIRVGPRRLGFPRPSLDIICRVSAASTRRAPWIDRSGDACVRSPPPPKN